jgi:oligoendopeptidase F
MNDLKIYKKQRTYISADLNMQWEYLEPIFNELINRSINSVSELGQWLRDRSEIEAALEEDFAWRYIRMTCDTTDEKLLNDFQFFATEIEPKIAPLNNELNQKFIQCPFAEELDKAKYFVYVRGIKKALELFREENIPLLTQIQVEQQKYQGITGSMSVIISGQEYTLEQAAVLLKDTDRKIRKEAWEAITARRLEDKEKLDELFNSLLKLRHQVALNAGFENFRDYMFQALGRFDYSPGDCYDFHKAIQKEIVPILKKQAENRLKALNLSELKPWDMDVDISGKAALKPFRNGEELIESLFNVFADLVRI